jgi:hypothetical protein
LLALLLPPFFLDARLLLNTTFLLLAFPFGL